MSCIPQRLRAEVGVFGALGAGLVITMVITTSGERWWGPFCTLFCVVWLGTRLFSRLDLNRSDDTSAIRSSLGIATWVTAIRALLIAYLSSLLFATYEAWVAFGLYAGAILLDRADGYIARALRTTSKLGAQFDVEVDALGLMVAPLVSVVHGRLPPFYLILSAAYYVFVAVLWVWSRCIGPVYRERLRSSSHSRMFAGFQMALVALSFVPIVPSSLLQWMAPLFMAPVLAGFVRDFAFATGYWIPGSGHYRGVARFIIHSVEGWLPVACRVLFGVLVFYFEVWRNTPLFLIFVVGVVSVLSGIFPRVGAIAILSTFMLRPPSPENLACSALMTCVLLFGGGRWSFGPTEDRWLLEKRGETGVLPSLLVRIRTAVVGDRVE